MQLLGQLRGKERAVIFTLHEGADLQNRIVRQRAVLRDLEQLWVKLAPLYMHQLVRLDGADEAILRVDQIRPVGALLPCTLRAERRGCQRLLEVQPCSDPDRQSVGRSAVDLRQKIKEGKTIPYILLCLFAAQFHNSAYLFIPVYFMVTGRAWSPKQNLIIIAAVVGLLFLRPILDVVESSLANSTYDYAVAAMNSDSGSSIIRPVIAAVPVVIAYIHRDRIDAGNKMIHICINMSLINFLLNLLATFTC